MSRQKSLDWVMKVYLWRCWDLFVKVINVKVINLCLTLTHFSRFMVIFCERDDFCEEINVFMAFVNENCLFWPLKRSHDLDLWHMNTKVGLSMALILKNISWKYERNRSKRLGVVALYTDRQTHTHTHTQTQILSAIRV